MLRPGESPAEASANIAPIPQRRWPRWLLIGLPALVVAAAVTLPFLNKAFNIDDLTFLLQAKHILKDPLHPTAFDMVFHGEKSRNSDGMVSGPIMAILLIPSILKGGAEWIAHLAQFFMLAIGLFSTARLALRMGLSEGRALFATLIVGCTPGVLAMTSSAMADVPALSLGMVGLERLTAWKQEKRWGQGILAGLFLALAALTRPHVLLLVPIGLIWLLPDEIFRQSVLRWFRPMIGRSAIPFAIALAFIVLCTVLLRDPQAGRNMAGTTVDWASRKLVHLYENLANLPLQYALSFPLVVFWVGFRGRRFFQSFVPWIGFLGGIELALSTNWRNYQMLAVPATGLGLAVILDVLVDAYRRRDQVQFVCGLWLLIPLPAAVYHHLPVKYLVPSAPAVAILAAREIRWEKKILSLAVTVPILAACISLAVAILVADTRLAEIGRRGGQLIAEKRVEYADRTIWLDGAWGFQWYGMKAGAIPLTTAGPFPKPGDLVVVGPQGKLTPKVVPKRTRIYFRDFNSPGGRVMQDGAGFHSNPVGPYPWTRGRASMGKLEVYTVDPFEPVGG